jgi:hypothetical protein
MLQPEILLRRRNPCTADSHPSSPRRWSKETRRSGFFEMKSLTDRRGKKAGLTYYPRATKVVRVNAQNCAPCDGEAVMPSII